MPEATRPFLSSLIADVPRVVMPNTIPARARKAPVPLAKSQMLPTQSPIPPKNKLPPQAAPFRMIATTPRKSELPVSLGDRR